MDNPTRLEPSAARDEVADDDRRNLTQPGGVPGFSVADRVLGLEHDMRALQLRQRERETAVDGRLREGAEAVSDLRAAVAPKPLSLVKFLPTLIDGVLSLLGFVWAAAQYPSRREFETLKADLSAIRLEQVQTTAKLDLILKGIKP
jgi:hypothetical protein